MRTGCTRANRACPMGQGAPAAPAGAWAVASGSLRGWHAAVRGQVHVRLASDTVTRSAGGRLNGTCVAEPAPAVPSYSTIRGSAVRRAGRRAGPGVAEYIPRQQYRGAECSCVLARQLHEGLRHGSRLCACTLAAAHS